MGFRCLVNDTDPLARLRRVLDREADALHRVLDIDESAGLSALAVHSQRIANRGLHQETIKYCAVIAVIVEPVDQALVADGFACLGAPDDTLVQVGNSQPVVPIVEGEQKLVLGFGQVIDTARVGGIEDFLLGLIAVSVLDCYLQIAFWNSDFVDAVTIDFPIVPKWTT